MCVKGANIDEKSKNPPSVTSNRQYVERAEYYCWLTDKQNEAVKWWKTATEEGEQIAVHPDLSKAY
jgi:hypothetical protein